MPRAKPFNYRYTEERMPWVQGHEPRTFAEEEFDQLMAALKPPMVARAKAAFRAVAVDRLSYVAAGKLLGEKTSYIRSAHLAAMNRVGHMGPSYFDPAFTNRLVIEGVPPPLHAGIREKVAQVIQAYRAQLEQAEAAAQHARENPPASPLAPESPPPEIPTVGKLDTTSETDEQPKPVQIKPRKILDTVNKARKLAHIQS